MNPGRRLPRADERRHDAAASPPPPPLPARPPCRGSALAGGGDYVFDGGTARQQAQVRAALEASSFDWDVVKRQVTVHVGAHGTSRSTPGHVWLDGGLLDTGRFAWAIVSTSTHTRSTSQCSTPPIVRGSAPLGAARLVLRGARPRPRDYGCERFATLVSWAYWPSQRLRPESAPTSRREAGGRFRAAGARLRRSGSCELTSVGDEREAEGLRNGLRPRVRAELRHRLADMRAHGLRRDEKRRRSPRSSIRRRAAAGLRAPAGSARVDPFARAATKMPARTGSTYVPPFATISTARTRSTSGASFMTKPLAPASIASVRSARSP